ncbi:glycosyltransferase [bacterium]|nr:MAG: glycosyltransferase [bacterium]
MRVLYVAPYVPSRLRPRPFNLLRELIRRGHEVTAAVLSVNRGDDAALEDLINLSLTPFVIHANRAKAVARAALSVAGSEPLDVAYCNCPDLRRIVRSLVAEGRFDVLHFEHLRVAGVGLQFRDVPRLFDSVDCMSALWESAARLEGGRSGAVARLQVGRVRRYEKALLPEFDAVTVSSRADAVALSTLAPSVRPDLVPNGVDADYFGQTQWQPQGDRVLFWGRLQYHANAHAVVDFCRTLWPRIRAERPNATLSIIGASPPRHVWALGEAPGITVTGFVRDLRPYLAQASVAICPVTVGAGTQFKALEALAAGVPLVATRRVIESLDLKNGTEALSAEDPKALCQAVLALLKNPELGRLMHKHGKDRVRRDFTWEAATNTIESAYERIVQRKQ